MIYDLMLLCIFMSATTFVLYSTAFRYAKMVVYIALNVRLWLKADLQARQIDVCFPPDSGHPQCHPQFIC